MFNIEKVAIFFVIILMFLVSTILWDIYLNVKRFVSVVERIADERAEESNVVVADGTGVMLTGRDAGKRVPKEDRYTGAAF